MTVHASLAVGTAVQEAAILPSLGSVGDGDDNAVAERCFAARKVALLHRQPWPTSAAARLAIFAFVEGRYNRRRHSTRGHRRPLEQEERDRQIAA